MTSLLTETAFKLLFNTHYEGLCRFANGYVKDPETAREIVQDAFVSLWEKRDTIDTQKPVRTYLTTAVRNKCLNYLRDNRKFSGDLLELENPGRYIPGEQQPRDLLVETEIQSRIKSAIGELPEKCREIFILSRYHNLRYQQIADKLQISVKTVETQMSKALLQMREKLKEYL